MPLVLVILAAAALGGIALAMSSRSPGTAPAGGAPGGTPGGTPAGTPAGGGGKGGGKKTGGKLPHGDPRPFLLIVEREAARHPEYRSMALLMGLIEHETGGTWDPKIKSWTGAVGLGQFTEIGEREVERLLTMARYRARFDDAPELLAKLSPHFDADATTDPERDIAAAALLLASGLAHWDGDEEAALTEYNAGPAAARIVHEKGGVSKAQDALAALGEKKSQADVYAPKVLAEARAFEQGGVDALV